MSELDTTIAPPGHYAQEVPRNQGCVGCAFYERIDYRCLERPCMPHDRGDGKFVIFLPLQTGERKEGQ